MTARTAENACPAAVRSTSRVAAGRSATRSSIGRYESCRREQLAAAQRPARPRGAARRSRSRVATSSPYASSRRTGVSASSGRMGRRASGTAPTGDQLSASSTGRVAAPARSTSASTLAGSESSALMARAPVGDVGASAAGRAPRAARTTRAGGVALEHADAMGGPSPAGWVVTWRTVATTRSASSSPQTRASVRRASSEVAQRRGRQLVGRARPAGRAYVGGLRQQAERLEHPVLGPVEQVERPQHRGPGGGPCGEHRPRRAAPG